MKNEKKFVIFILFTMLCNIFSPFMTIVNAEEMTINDYINSLHNNLNSINYKLDLSKNTVSYDDIDHLSALITVENDISNLNQEINNLSDELSTIRLSDLTQNNVELNNKYNNYLSKGCSDITININNITDISCYYEGNNITFEKEEIINQINIDYITPLKNKITNYNDHYDDKITEYKGIFNNYFNNEYVDTLEGVENIHNQVKNFIITNQTKGNKINELELFNDMTDDLNNIKNYKSASDINEIPNIKNNINLLVTSINNKSNKFYEENKSYIQLGLDTKINNLTTKYNGLINSYKNWLNIKGIDLNNITYQQMELNIDGDYSNLFTKTVDITNEYNNLNKEINIYLERMSSDKEMLDNLMLDLNNLNSKLNTNIVFTYMENLIEQSELSDEDTVDRLMFIKNFDINESIKEKLINKKKSFYALSINNYEYKIFEDKIFICNTLNLPTNLMDSIVYNATFRLENNMLYLNDRNGDFLNKYKIKLIGDLNNDYLLDKQDLDLLYQLIISENINEEQLSSGDLNYDAVLNDKDLYLLNNLINNNFDDITEASYRVIKSTTDNTITYNIYLKSNGIVNGFSYKIKTSKDLVLSKIINTKEVLIKDNLVIGYGTYNDGDLLLSIIYNKNDKKEDYTLFEIYDGIIFGNLSKVSNYKDIIKNKKEEIVKTTNSVVDTNNIVVQELILEPKEIKTIKDEPKENIDKNITITDVKDTDKNKIEWKNIIKVIVIVLLGALIIYFLSKEDDNDNNNNILN